jgi:SOS-response transcriptional repressor LexA
MSRLSETNTASTNLVAENLRWLLRQSRTSQNGLALATGVKQATINRIVLGKNIAPRDTTLHALAKHFDLTVEDLKFKKLSDQTSSLPQNLKGYRVPMISARLAGLQEITDQWPDTVVVFFEVSKRAFAMSIADEAMAPLLQLSDVVIVDGDREATPGKLVAVRVEGEDQALVRTFKSVKPMGAEPYFELVPLSQYFRTLRSIDDVAITVLGQVVARWSIML